MTGCIEIENMEFFAYHGCYKEEQIVGNKFLVNIYIKTDCRKASQTDSIYDALNYQEVYNLIKAEMAITSHLLEHVCGRIINRLKAAFPSIDELRVRVSKMNPPMGGKMDKVSVEFAEKY